MHQKLQIINCTAIKHLVYSSLLAAVNIYTSHQTNVCITDVKIPLSLGRDDSCILYISGLALQLSKSENLQAMEIASGIVSHLSANCNKYFKIQIVTPGWIYLEVSHLILAAWLQRLASGRVEVGKENTHSPTPHSRTDVPLERLLQTPLFTVQYAHARCCSLVRLALQEGLIKFNERVSPRSHTTLNPIPWLNCDQMRLNHPASHRLISKLVQVVDNLEYPCAVNWEKAALDLSRAFETFWCKCRIWGEVKTDSLELAQARVGLVMATQSVLRFLLEEKLGIFALQEI